MDNRSYRHQYIEEYVQDERFTEQTIVTNINFWKRVEKTENVIGKHLEDGYAREEYISLFNKLKLTTPQSMTPRKTTIRNYIQWLCEQGVLDEEPLKALDSVTYHDINADDYYENGFFKDFGDLKDKIESALIATEVIDDRRYGTEVTAILLAWCGITAEEAITIRKEDVHEDYISTKNGELRPVSYIMSFLNDYKDQTDYQVMLPQGVATYKYVWSDFLLRTSRQDRIRSGRNLRILLNNFSKQAEAQSNPFSYNKIYWSGVYHRAYLYECANGPIKPGNVETIQKIFGETYSYVQDANKRLYAYQRYKEYFFPSAKQS